MERLAINTALLAAGLFLLAGAGSVRAADKKDHGKHEQPTKIKGLVHKDGKEVEVNFDLSKPDDLQKLLDHVKKNEVEELKKDKPVNLLALAYDLGLWTIVVFLLLFFILKKMAWGPILEGLQKREDNIHAALAEAKKAREDAKTIQAELQKKMDAAAQTVAGMIEEARRDAQHTRDEMLSQARNEIQLERDRLRREIDTARDQALQELWQKSAEMATLISEKVVRRHLSLDDHRQLVKDALDDMSKAGNGKASA